MKKEVIDALVLRLRELNLTIDSITKGYEVALPFLLKERDALNVVLGMPDYKEVKGGDSELEGKMVKTKAVNCDICGIVCDIHGIDVRMIDGKWYCGDHVKGVMEGGDTESTIDEVIANIGGSDNSADIGDAILEKYALSDKSVDITPKVIDDAPKNSRKNISREEKVRFLKGYPTSSKGYFDFGNKNEGEHLKDKMILAFGYSEKTNYKDMLSPWRKAYNEAFPKVSRSNEEKQVSSYTKNGFTVPDGSSWTDRVLLVLKYKGEPMLSTMIRDYLEVPKGSNALSAALWDLHRKGKIDKTVERPYYYSLPGGKPKEDYIEKRPESLEKEFIKDPVLMHKGNDDLKEAVIPKPSYPPLDIKKPKKDVPKDMSASEFVKLGNTSDFMNGSNELVVEIATVMINKPIKEGDRVRFKNKKGEMEGFLISKYSRRGMYVNLKLPVGTIEPKKFEEVFIEIVKKKMV